ILAVNWSDPRAVRYARQAFSYEGFPDAWRLDAAGALIPSGDDSLVEVVAKVLRSELSSHDFKRSIIAVLGASSDPRLAGALIDSYKELAPPLRPPVIELLTQRPPWTVALLDAVGKGALPKDAVGLNEVRKLAAGSDKEIARR